MKQWIVRLIGAWLGWRLGWWLVGQGQGHPL